MNKRGPLSSETLAKDSKERAEARLALERDDFKEVVSTAPGRRFMWRLINARCGVTSSSYSSDPYATAFGEGQRGVGIKLLNDMQEVAPEQYVVMLTEALRQQHEDAHVKASAEKSARAETDD